MFDYKDVFSRAVIQVNDEKPIKGVILSFHGLSCFPADFELCEERLHWFQNGWMIVTPYCGPWSWLNDNVISYINTLLDFVWEKYDLNDNLPVIYYGGSMGGYAALLYLLQGNRKASRCIAKYPVCDLEYHRDERDDVRRTLVSAFWNSQYQSWDALFAERSPLCRLSELPKIPYLFVHSENDTKVSKIHHSDVMVEKMRERGYDVTYLELSGYDHAEPLSEDIVHKVAEFLD